MVDLKILMRGNRPSLIQAPAIHRVADVILLSNGRVNTFPQQRSQPHSNTNNWRIHKSDLIETLETKGNMTCCIYGPD
jgi:hypothetical protein